MDIRDSRSDSNPNRTQTESDADEDPAGNDNEGRVEIVRRTFLRAGAVAVGLLPFGGVGTAAASTDLDDVTGFHPPQVDGQPYGHGGESLPDGKEGEWADARSASVELVRSEEGQDFPATLYTKVVESTLFLAIHAEGGETTGTLKPAKLSRFRLQLDRDGSGDLSPGDVRFIGHPRTRSDEPVELDPADGILSVQWQLEVFDGETFVPRGVESSPASMMASSSDEGGLGVEARVDLRDVDEILDDESTEEGELGFSLDLQFEDILYGVGAVPDDVYDESVYGGRYGPPTAPVLPEDNSSVERLEVTQSTQDANNSQDLVKDKETLARVFVDHPEPRPVTVDVTLKATTLKGGTWTTLGELSQEFEAPPTPTDREERDHSANFELPASWRTQNFILLIAKVSRPGHVVTTTDPRSDSARFTPVDTYNPNILFIRVNEGTAEDPDLPSKRATRLTKDAFRRMMPITDPWFITLGSGTLGPVDDDDHLIAELDEIAETFRTGFTFGTAVDQIFGQTQDYGSGGGLSDPVWGGGGPSNHFATWGELGSSSRELVMAHEVNHNIGGKRWAFHVAGCGSGGGDSNFPHSNTDINEVGWDPAASDMVPASRGELMTYCGTWRNPSKWIGPYRWDHLIGRLHGWIPEQPVHQDFQPQVSSSLTARADGGTQEEPPTARVITGFLYEDGGGELRPSFEFPGETDDPDPEVTDPQAILRIERESETVDINVGASFEPLEQETVDRSAFSFSVPDNGTIEDIKLLDTDENVIDEFTNYEPEGIDATVDIPPEFERDELYTLHVDIPAESDEVTFYRRLLYSPDGENWLPYGRTFTDDTYPVRFTEEPGGKNAQFMLLISDGVRTKRVKSESFALPSRPPEVQIDRAHRWVAEGGGEEGETDGDDENGERGRGNAGRDAPEDVEIDEIRNAADPIETVVGATVSVRGVGLDERGIELPPDWLSWEVTEEDGAPVQVTGSAKGNRFVHQFDRTGTYTVVVEGSDRRIGRSATDEIVVEVSEPPLPPTGAVKAFTRTRDLDETIVTDAMKEEFKEKIEGIVGGREEAG